MLLGFAHTNMCLHHFDRRYDRRRAKETCESASGAVVQRQFAREAGLDILEILI